MVNTRKPPSVSSAPTPPLVIRNEQDAREAFGSAHGLERFLRPQVPAPAVYALPGAGGVLPPGASLTVEGPSLPLASVRVDGLGWPAPAAAWHRLELSHDPQRSPPVSCRVDGAPVELEQHLDGVWRPRRTETNG